MRRLALILVAGSACLEPGSSLYERSDTTPPQVLFELCSPHILLSDAGTVPLEAAGLIQLAFSEPLDPDSLRPGILVRINPERTEVPLTVQAPPAGTRPYIVRILPGEPTYKSATYTLQLRSLLIDLAGNPLPEGPELTGFFKVP